ncbi:hypothetical protein V500_08058, partial [Pseudogymnoascus sp. VKM F-4518 (FW-2643)]
MEAPAPRTPPLDPSKCNSTVETMRCSRCAMSAETVSHSGRDVSADDARAGGMVKFGHNLYYCDRCAKIDHNSFPVELHGRSGKARASLLPPKSTADIFEARNGRNVGTSYLLPRYAQTAGTFSIAPASLETQKRQERQCRSPTLTQCMRNTSPRHITAQLSQQAPKKPFTHYNTFVTKTTTYHPKTTTTHTPTTLMPKLPPPYRPDFDAETALPIHLIQASWLAFLTTTLALLLLACFLIFLLRLCVLYDRQLALDGFIGGVPREEKILRRCEERGRRVCRERGVWDVGARGGPPVRDYEVGVGGVDEKRRGKRLRFLPVAEVIPPDPTAGDEPATGEKRDKGKGRERQRARSHSSHIGSGHCASEDWGMYSLISVAGVTARRRPSSVALERGEWAGPPSRRRASADWV